MAENMKFSKHIARNSFVFACCHEGPPQQYLTEHGTETAEDGDYVVKVNEVPFNQFTPPREENGKKIPGAYKTVMHPRYEVMKAQDFNALYVAVTEKPKTE